MALLKVKNGVYSSIGFWMEHKNYGKTGKANEMGKHAVSVSALEKLTGINFFHNLPDNVEQRVESNLTLSVLGLVAKIAQKEEQFINPLGCISTT